jgi:3-phenylpropionate/trans-cinnamate dioxygenase ferredoxin reductase subunit
MSGSVVIVGTGQAGCQLAFSLRERRFEGEITLVGAEHGLPYQKPPMSKGFLHATLDEADLALKPIHFFEQKKIAFHPEMRATGLDRVARSLLLQSGATIGFDHLVIAAGAENRALPIDGAALDGVVMLRSRQDAVDLRRRLASTKRLVIVGAGFIGMEVAASVSQLGIEVTVVERVERVMARAVSQPISDHFLALQRDHGVRVLLGAGVSAFLGDGSRLRAVQLADGEVIPTELALVAVGVTPTTDLAAAAGLPVGNGIIVDETLTTADPAIHAIGDCANVPHPLLDGRRVRIESVQNAVDQARCLALTLTGTPTVFAKVAWFWSDQWDTRLQIAGIGSDDDEAVVRGDPATGRFSVFRLNDGRLTCVESVNETSVHMASRALVQQRPQLDRAAITDLSISVKELGR